MATRTLYPSIAPSLDLNFAGSKTLDPRITFSRASAATYYDGKTVAKAEENLFTLSQEFSNSFWNKYDATVAGSSTTAPDGTLTASKLSEASTASVSKRIDCTLPSFQSTNYTISIYAKSAELSYLRITEASTGTARTSWFNVAAGTLGTTSPSHSATIIAVGNGWFRCSIAFLASTVTPGPSFGISNADNVSVYAGNGSDGLHIWGAQLEQRSQVTAYTPTTTQPITNYIPVLQTALAGVPRFDHNPVTGESLGLLVEEQRTNLLNGSEDFTSGYWTVDAGLSVVPSQILAPDGKQTATLLKEDGASSARRLRRNMQQSAAGDYTVTVYVKFAGRRRFRLIELSQIGGNVEFDVVAGAVVATSAPARNGTITPVGNGWYRCSATWAFLASTPTNVFINILDDSGTQVYKGNNYSGIYIWGAQLEAGAFATSYIKTEASQVTRAADSASMTGANFSSWYRQDEGALFVKYKVATVGVAPGMAIASADNGVAHGILLYKGLNAASITAYKGSVAVSIGSISASEFVASVVSYDSTQLSAAGNSTAVQTVTATSYPAPDRFRFGSNWNGLNLTGYIKRLAYYPKRLTDAQLQALAL